MVSSSSTSHDFPPPDDRDGNDALCFTPGFPGATFSAGAIHAYLAADREPPKVVAGISLGTLSAAVIQRCYKDLQEAKCNFKQAKAEITKDPGNIQKAEAVEQSKGELIRTRWMFFRKYLSAITDRPFDVIWKGIPDPTDFFADLPPIKDPVPETITDPNLRKKWKEEELASRNELYLLVKLGHWLAKSPIRISTIANLIVSYVRSKERYPSAKTIRVLIAKLWQVAAAISLVLHIVRAPERFPAYKFQVWREQNFQSSWQFHAHQAREWLLHGRQDGWLKLLYGTLNLLSLFGLILTGVIWSIRFFPVGKAWIVNPHTGFWSGLFVNFPAITLYTFISLALLHILLLAAISKRHEETSSELPSWWFQFRSGAEWLMQKPLFGWPMFISGSCFLAILQIYTAILSVASLKYLLESAWYQIALGIVASVVCLFFTASLATWRVPMKGKFPFRAVPLICSIVMVGFFVLCLHAEPFVNTILGNQYAAIDLSWSLMNSSKAFHFLGGALGHPWIATLVVAVLCIVLYSLALADDVRDEFIKSLLARVKMEKHMVHDYHLKYALTSLFGKDANSPTLDDKPFPVVLVATPLQSIGAEPTLNNQLWANATSKPKLVDVLRATLAVPVVLDPLSVKGEDLKVWYKTDTDTDTKNLDMVDAAIVRQNPLPALFNFLRREGKIVKFLGSDSPSHAKVHVVYSVPAQPPSPDGTKKLDNIIDVAFLSLRLAKRRDINLEIDQTNFIARLAYVTNDLLEQLSPDVKDPLKKQAPANPIFPIFADHISPSNDLTFANALAPTRDEVLKHAATGCKATLEQLYAPQISKIAGAEIDCPTFLTRLRTAKDPDFRGPAGLPEICRHCDKQLRASRDSGRKAVFAEEEVQGWRDRKDLATEFPQLKGDEPRIVFVASGGVFRGPFHAGMINAMLALNIKPDLIVGASVGTLVGAALAAALAATNHQDALDVLCALVDTFQQSDEKVAFTKTLKNAARELGIRGRNVDLAPHELRKKILEGTKADPAFAVTGTPPVLIDAISELLLLPHENTKKIAAQFVAGHFTDATRCLIEGIREETLRRLEIVNAVMGASLLEPTARRLLGSMLGYNMNDRQPYKDAKIALFGTSTNLKHQQPVLLGRYKFELPSYDFVNACLASSAFPAVFAPRTEDQIFPGLGDPDEIYSDGGMFDNLPISPALEILTASQRNWINETKADAVNEMGKRVQNPDLFITGSLDITASQDEKIFDNLVSIKRRAGTLQNNVKIKAFEEISGRIGEHLSFLHKIAQAARATGLTNLPHNYLNGLVNAVLLPVYPTDAKHLNGTFQFCNSMGRDVKVVNASMADGCFRTLKEFAEAVDSAATSIRATAVQGLAINGRLPVLAAAPGPKHLIESDAQGSGHYCPFFRKSEQNGLQKFVCPFSERPESMPVFQSCIRDQQHQNQHHQLNKIQTIAPPCVDHSTVLKTN